MRSRKVILNTIAGLLYELTAIVCGFVLPRLILSAFGSTYNGITSSIAQFLGYVSLMKAGIGGVTKAALYKPLATHNKEETSAIINATDRFLKRVSLIFSTSLIVFAAIYPIFVRKDFDWLFTFTLVLILGISTFVQYFFGLTYQLLLQSDQRQCVISFVQIGTTILNTLLAALLIKLGADIHIVKLGSAIAFSLNPLIINLYARRFYKIDKSVPPNNDAIKDRWDCFGLQVANFVNSNTDMFILTVFTNVKEVSVYTVYYMVTNGVRKLLLTFVNGIGAAFGNMFAKNEEENIRKNLLLFEQITFLISNFLFSVTFIMVLNFVRVYTKGISDANYIRPAFAYVLVIATLFGAYRIPYQSIVEAVGHFKQTRNGAFFEAILNIVVSVIMVIKFGLVGVAIGTLCATVFRTFQYCTYMSRNVIKRSLFPLIKRLILSAISFGLVIVLSNLFNLRQPTSYVQWIIQAIPVAIISAIVNVSIELIFYKGELKLIIKKITNAFFKSKKGKIKNYDKRI